MVGRESSGDPLADRLLGYAEDFADRGDLEAAASLLEQAIERHPQWPPALFRLAQVREEARDFAGAAQAYRDCLACQQVDRLGAGPRLALLGLSHDDLSLPQDYVRTLFDDYADRFDRSLVETLGYSGPEHVRTAVDALFPTTRYGLTVLDLGCGTGLCGMALRDRASRLDGVDLSPGMLAQARRKGIYDRLYEAEAVGFLQDQIARGHTHDLVMAADIVPYLGDLAGLFDGLAGVLAPGGAFVVLAQAMDAHEQDPAYRLGADMRFSHSVGYLTDLAKSCGLHNILLRNVEFRRDRGVPVTGVLMAGMSPAIGDSNPADAPLRLDALPDGLVGPIAANRQPTPSGRKRI